MIESGFMRPPKMKFFLELWVVSAKSNVHNLIRMGSGAVGYDFYAYLSITFKQFEDDCFSAGIRILFF